MEETTRIENKELSSGHVLTYRPELDGLRAIAVLSVIFYHAGFVAICPGGFLGVDVFFVLSGYLMTSIILRECESNKFTLLRFYERRVRRILPMLFFTIAICYPPAHRLLLDKDFSFFANSGYFASIGLSNFLFASLPTGYFDRGTDLIPLVHTWTLGVEEQFYAIIPLVFITLWPRFGRNFVLFVLVLMAFGSFGCNFMIKNVRYNFYMLYARFWELAIGSMVVFIPKQNYSNVFSFLGFASIIAAILGYSKSTQYFYYTELLANVLATFGTALFVVFTNEKTVIGRLISLKTFVWIGLVSYSAYLLHQPLFVFARLHNYTSSRLGELEYSALIGLIFFLSFLTWRFVECPFRNRQLISMKTILILALVNFVLIRPEFLSFILKSKDSVNIKELSFIDIDCNGGGAKTTLNNQSIGKNYSNKLYKTMPDNDLFNFRQDSPMANECFQRYTHGKEDTEIKFCHIGRDNVSSSLSSAAYFLFGDSISMAFTNAFNQLQQPGLFAAFDGTRCSPLFTSTPLFEPQLTTEGFECERLTKAVYEHIKATPSIRAIFFASIWIKWNNFTAEHFNHTLNIYRELNVQVYVIQQPAFQEAIGGNYIQYVYKQFLKKDALTDAALRNISCTRTHYNEQQKIFLEFFSLFNTTRGFNLIRVDDLICDAEVCAVGIGLVPFYMDEAHMTWVGVLRVVERLRKYVSGLV